MRIPDFSGYDKRKMCYRLGDKEAMCNMGIMNGKMTEKRGGTGEAKRLQNETYRESGCPMTARFRKKSMYILNICQQDEG